MIITMQIYKNRPFKIDCQPWTREGKSRAYEVPGHSSVEQDLNDI
jgi:hypothetical protein